MKTCSRRRGDYLETVERREDGQIGLVSRTFDTGPRAGERETVEHTYAFQGEDLPEMIDLIQTRKFDSEGELYEIMTVEHIPRHRVFRETPEEYEARMQEKFEREHADEIRKAAAARAVEKNLEARNRTKEEASRRKELMKEEFERRAAEMREARQKADKEAKAALRERVKSQMKQRLEARVECDLETLSDL